MPIAETLNPLETMSKFSGQNNSKQFANDSTNISNHANITLFPRSNDTVNNKHCLNYSNEIFNNVVQYDYGHSSCSCPTIACNIDSLSQSNQAVIYQTNNFNYHLPLNDMNTNGNVASCQLSSNYESSKKQISEYHDYTGNTLSFTENSESTPTSMQLYDNDTLIHNNNLLFNSTNQNFSSTHFCNNYQSNENRVIIRHENTENCPRKGLDKKTLFPFNESLNEKGIVYDYNNNPLRNEIVFNYNNNFFD